MSPANESEVARVQDALLGNYVSIRRSGAKWEGEVVAISHGPAVLIEEKNGQRVLVNMDGATIDLDPVSDTEKGKGVRSDG